MDVQHSAMERHKEVYVQAMEGKGCLNDEKRDEDGAQRPQRKGGRMAGLNKSLY